MQTLLAPKAVTATNTTAEPPRGASHAEAPEPTEDPASTPLRLSFNENEGKAMDLTKLCKRTRDSSDEDDLAPRKNTATCSTEFSESSEEKSHTWQGSKETGSESTAIVDTDEASTAAESPLAVPADATHSGAFGQQRNCLRLFQRGQLRTPSCRGPTGRPIGPGDPLPPLKLNWRTDRGRNDTQGKQELPISPYSHWDKRPISQPTPPATV